MGAANLSLAASRSVVSYKATALATQLVVRGLRSAEPVFAEAWRGHGADRRDLSGRWYETGQSIGGTLHGGKR